MDKRKKAKVVMASKFNRTRQYIDSGGRRLTEQEALGNNVNNSQKREAKKVAARKEQDSSKPAKEAKDNREVAAGDAGESRKAKWFEK